MIFSNPYAQIFYTVTTLCIALAVVVFFQPIVFWFILVLSLAGLVPLTFVWGAGSGSWIYMVQFQDLFYEKIKGSEPRQVRLAIILAGLCWVGDIILYVSAFLVLNFFFSAGYSLEGGAFRIGNISQIGFGFLFLFPAAVIFFNKTSWNYYVMGGFHRATQGGG